MGHNHPQQIEQNVDEFTGNKGTVQIQTHGPQLAAAWQIHVTNRNMG